MVLSLGVADQLDEVLVEDVVPAALSGLVEALES